MRKEPLLTAVPPAPVRSLRELYAIAFDLAERAVQRYGALAERIGENCWPVRSVFEVLGRASAIGPTACPQPASPSAASGPIAPICAGRRSISFRPRKSLTLRISSLSTPYTAWALGVRHRQRAFVFWTYVIALAEDPLVRRTAEDLANEALSDGNLLRRERRLARRAERTIGAKETTTADETASAALLESLLLRDMMAWSQGLGPAQREQLLTLGTPPLPDRP